MKISVLNLPLVVFVLVLTQGYLTYSLALMSLASLFMIAFIVHLRQHILSTRLTINRLIVLIILGSMIIGFPFGLFKTTTAVFHFGMGVLSILCAFVLSRFPNEVCRAVGVSLYVAQAATLFFLFTTDIAILPLDHMYEAGSSNGITSVLVVLQATYAGLCFVTRRGVPVISSFVTVYICIAGFSRGSILASALICFVVLTGYVLSIRPPTFRLSIIFLGVLSTALLFYLNYDTLLSFVELETKFAQGFEDSHREQIHKDYLGKIDVLTFFTGADFSNTSIQSEYNNNPHSSLIRAHHLFGILYLVSVVFSIVLGVFSFKRSNGFLFIGALVFIMLLRGLSEPLFFPTPMDFLLFLVIFSGSASLDCQRGHDVSCKDPGWCSVSDRESKS